MRPGGGLAVAGNVKKTNVAGCKDSRRVDSSIESLVSPLDVETEVIMAQW